METGRSRESVEGLHNLDPKYRARSYRPARNHAGKDPARARQGRRRVPRSRRCPRWWRRHTPQEAAPPMIIAGPHVDIVDIVLLCTVLGVIGIAIVVDVA